MKLQLKIALAVGALAMLALPATAAAQPPEGVPPYNGSEHPEGGEHPTSPPVEPPANGENGEGSRTPGPGASLPEKAKAYGVRCAGESREHVDGEQGTAFSRCVNAMAKAASHELLSPARACAGLSKEHVKGEKGTEFSRCVRDAAKLQHQQRAKAYGHLCDGESREHVKGEKGTAFSRCVKAMARAANLEIGPRKACVGLSKEHVEGERGTEFSRCVRDAAKLIREQRQEEREGEGSEGE